MRKNVICVLATLLFITASKAQFVPVGSKWYYGIKSSIGNPTVEGVFSYTCEKDTIINSEIYSKIVYNAKDDSTLRIFYLTKDSTTIYYWDRANKKTLFKTACQVNDTIIIDCFLSNPVYPYQDTSISLSVVINKISHEKLNSLANDSLKIYHYNILNFTGIPYSSRVGVFAEKLINIINDNNRDLLVLTQQLAIPEGGDYLRCFNSSIYNFKSKFTPHNVLCDFDNVGIYESIKKNETRVHPNPNSGLFTVRFNDNSARQISVYNIFNNLVYTIYSTDIEVIVNLSGIEKGLYFVNIQSTSRQLNSKIIVQ